MDQHVVEERLERRRHGREQRAFRALCGSQFVAALGLAAGAAGSPVLAERVTGEPSSGTIAMAALVLGAAAAGPGAGEVMRRSGRVVGIMACYFAATLGTVIVLLAEGSQQWFLLGTGLLGAGTTGAMLGRYAAAELSPTRAPQRAMATAVGLLTLGLVVGPALLGPLGPVATALGRPPEAALHVLALAAFPAAILVQVPVLKHQNHRSRDDNSPAAHSRLSGVWPPLVVLGLSNVAMVAAMGAVPPSLRGSGHSLSLVGAVMALHTAMMFAPSVWSEKLTSHWGAERTTMVGAFVMAFGIGLVGFPTQNIASAIVGLALVGLAWNVQLVSATSWIMVLVPPDARHSLEGLAEMTTGLAASIGMVALAGPLLRAGGLPLLSTVLIGVSLLMVLALSRLQNGAMK